MTGGFWENAIRRRSIDPKSLRTWNDVVSGKSEAGNLNFESFDSETTAERASFRKWRLQLWRTELRRIERGTSWDNLLDSSEASALLHLLLLLQWHHLQTLQLPRSQSEERRRTCSRWLSFSQTGDSDITWPRLTGPAFPMRLPRSISTR